MGARLPSFRGEVLEVPCLCVLPWVRLDGVAGGALRYPLGFTPDPLSPMYKVLT